MTVINIIEVDDIGAPVYETDICAICMDINSIPQWQCKQCNAIFHKTCINEWAKKSSNYPNFYVCPICKLKYKLYNCICIYRRIFHMHVCLVIAYFIAALLVLLLISNSCFLIYIFVINLHILST